MIYFKTIRWMNFLSTGNTFTEISFIKHKTTLIIGENGAGKSTMLDALSFAMYGKPFRNIKKNQLINTINGKGAVVELEFNIGKKQYKIIRGIKPNIFEVYCDDVLVDQHADAKEYQNMLETQILKLNQKSFAQIVILGSASFIPFMQLPTAHRREIIEDLLDIQIFSTMNGLLKDRAALNRIKTGDVDHAIRSSADKIELYKKHIDSLRQNTDELIKQKQDRILSLESDIDTASSQIATLNGTVSELLESIADQTKVKTKSSKIVEISHQVENKLARIKKDVSFFETHDDCPTCRQGIQHEHKQVIIDTNTAQIAEIERGKARIQEELDALNTRVAEISKINSEVLQHNNTISNLNVEIRTWKNFIRDINKEIESLRTNTSQIDANNEEITQLKKVLAEALAQKEELSKDKQVYDIAAVLLKDTGIKTKIIKQYVPIINKLINKYLAAMDFFVNFELNETFEEVIKSRFRDEFTYDSFSEGEKSRIDLALLFTWRAIAKLRNSASTNLLIMDEVFDGSLDVQGGDELIKIIQSVVGDSNIFVISHKTDQLMDKFEHTIKFEKYKNFSRIAN